MTAAAAMSATRGAPACPLCGGETGVLYAHSYDDRYGFPGIFETRRCDRCRHSFVPFDFRPEQLTRLYSLYYPRARFTEADYRVPEESRGLWAWFRGERCSAFRWVPAGVRVLDIGCGFGLAVGYHKARGCDAHGIEADENVRAIAEKFELNIRIGVFEAGAYPEAHFDVVTMDQVIEHFRDPAAILRGVARVLKPGGRLIMSTPNAGGWGARVFGRRWINWHVPYHLQHFSKSSMRRLAAEAGLELEAIRTLTHSEWLYYQWLHLFSRPRPGFVSPFWAPQDGHRGIPYPYVSSMLAKFHRLGFDHVLTRIFDALGVGDNMIAFMRKPA